MKYHRAIPITLALIIGVVIGGFVFGKLGSRREPQSNPDLSKFEGTWYGAKTNGSFPPGFRPLSQAELDSIEKGIPPANRGYTAKDFITYIPTKTLHIGPKSISIFSDDDCTTWMCQKQDGGNAWATFEMKYGGKSITGRLELISEGLLRFNEEYYLNKHVTIFD